MNPTDPDGLAPTRPAGTRPRFFFIRHGETDWNREGRLQGQRDIPLNPRGRDQASATGHILRRLLAARRLDADNLDFVASPLGRARASMELLRQAIQLPTPAYRLDIRLTEIGFGAWEGMTWAEIAAADPERYRTRKRDKWGYVPPAGESYAMVAERIRPWLDTLAKDAVVVAHGGVARAILMLATGLDPRRAPAAEIHQGRVLVVEAGQAEWM